MYSGCFIQIYLSHLNTFNWSIAEKRIHRKKTQFRYGKDSTLRTWVIIHGGKAVKFISRLFYVASVATACDAYGCRSIQVTVSMSDWCNFCFLRNREKSRASIPVSSISFRHALTIYWKIDDDWLAVTFIGSQEFFRIESFDQ